MRVTVAAKVHDEEGGIHDVEIELPVMGFSTKFEVDGSRTRYLRVDIGETDIVGVTIKMPPVGPAQNLR
jgi:hypothetical protein